MNEALTALTDWATKNGVDLSDTSIRFDAGRTVVRDHWNSATSSYDSKFREPRETRRIEVTFNFQQELPSNLRALKRACPLVQEGDPGFITLKNEEPVELLVPPFDVDDGKVTLRITVRGAFECTTTCKPAVQVPESVNDE